MSLYIILINPLFQIVEKIIILDKQNIQGKNRQINSSCNINEYGFQDSKRQEMKGKGGLFLCLIFIGRIR